MAVETPSSGPDTPTAGDRLRTFGRAVVDHPLGWLAPALVFMAVFRLYPLFEAGRLSLTDTSLLELQSASKYVGLAQFVRLFQSPEFWGMLEITGIYAIASVVIHVALALVIALAIDYGVRRRLYGHLATRIAVLLAWVVPGIIIGVIWQLLLIESRVGIINSLLAPLTSSPIAFLSDPTLALVSAITAGSWRGTAFAMIMLYAGLQRVPEDLYQAARVDGAGPLQRFRYITIPQLKPVIFMTVVLETIYALNTFDLIYALTGGGPGQATEVLALFMYQEGFADYGLGRAAAIAIVMLVINLVMTVVYLQVFEIREEL